MTDNGRTTNMMAKESTLGLTGENMRDSSLMVNKRDMDCLLRPMAANITGNGRAVKRMAKESILGLTGENMRDST